MALMNLFRPPWKHSDPDVRKAAVQGIDDPDILVEMIIRDGEWFVRHEAMSALRDLGADRVHLRRLVGESSDEEIRRKAVKVMTDEADLERVAKEDRYRYVREAAEHRLGEIRSGQWAHLSD